MAATAVLLALSSCSKEQGNGGGEGGNVLEASVNASESGVWQYFSFAEGKVVGSGKEDETDNAAWAARTDWDIAINRYRSQRRRLHVRQHRNLRFRRGGTRRSHFQHRQSGHLGGDGRYDHDGKIGSYRHPVQDRRRRQQGNAAGLPAGPGLSVPFGRRQSLLQGAVHPVSGRKQGIRTRNILFCRS